MMSPRLRTLFAATMFALATSACDQPNPEAPAAPQRQALLSTYAVVQSTDTDATSSASVTGVIDSAGGTLTVAGHMLTIFPGYITEPTEFTMTAMAGSIEVALSARSVATGLPVRVFPSGLRLSLSYGKAKVGNPNRLKIAFILGGQIVTVQPSDVDKSNQLVTSWIYHFSDYGLVSD